MRILQTLTVALALLSPLSVGEALAVDANTCGYVQGNGGWYKSSDRSGPYSLDGSCNATLLGTGTSSGGGGGGASGPFYVGQYTSSPRSFTDLQVGYVQLDSAGRIVLSPSSTISTSFAPAQGSQEQDVRVTSTLNAATANAAVTINVNGQSTVGFTFSGLTASGATLTYEQSNDNGTTWTGVNEVNAGTGVPAGTRTTDGQTRISVTGRTNARVRVSTTGTGTVTVAYNLSVREGLFTLASPLPPGSNALGSVLADLRVSGAANSAGNPVFAQITNFPSSQAVTNTGTFATQLTASIPAGSNNIGTIGNAFALDTTLQNVATSNAAINVATGTQADAATASGANTTIVGALRAIRDRLLGTLSATLAAGSNTIGAVTQAGTWAVNSTLQAGANIIGKVGIDQTTPGVTNGVVQTPGTAISVQKTASIGTTGVQVSATDATNRRTVTNTSTLACEIMGSAAAYGTGYPLPAGGSFTFDASGRTTAAIFVACSAAGGTVAVLSF